MAMRPRTGLVVGTAPPPAHLRPLKQPLYDTLVYAAAGQLILRAFSIPQGQPIAPAGANKTDADTNLTQAGQLGTPNEFDLYGFNFEIENLTNINGAITDIRDILETGVFEFNFGANRPWLIVPLRDIPRGCGAHGGVQGDGYVALYQREVQVNGLGSPKEFYNFTIGNAPIRIRSNETFGVTLSWPLGVVAISAATRVRVYLQGILYTAL